MPNQNRAYLGDEVSLDIAQKFQSDNPHADVFYHGLPLEVAPELSRGVACDFDPLKRARHLVLSAPIGSIAHLMAVKTRETKH